MVTHASVFNRTLEFSQNYWVLSLAVTKKDANQQHSGINCDLHGHAFIFVEGVEDGNPFARIYDITRKVKYDYQISSFQKMRGNVGGIINVREIEGHENIRVRMEQCSNPEQWTVPAQAARRMVDSIRQAIAGQKELQESVDDLPKEKQSEAARQILLPFQTVGSATLLGGNGGENCITWAEKQLKLAGVGNRGKVLDYIKASPQVHITFSTSNMLKAISVVGITALAAFSAYRRWVKS